MTFDRRTKTTTGAVAVRASGKPVRVSFSGLDGAGKSHQIDALVKAIGRERSVDVQWVPFKIWPEPLLNRLPARFRSRLGPKRSGTSTSKDPAGTTSGKPALIDKVRPAIWTVVGTLAACSTGLSLRRRASGAADLVVLDRYRLDSIVKLQFWYGDVSGPLLARVVRALAPTPDIEFLLKVDPEVAYERKPEQWTVAQLSRQARLYDQLAAAPSHVVLLDAHDDPDVLAQSVEAMVRAAIDDK